MKNYNQKIKSKIKLSVIVIARDEEEMIGDCLKSIEWADEIIVIDNDSRDRTPSIAKKHGATVIPLSVETRKEYSKLRNRGLGVARGDWVFYLDADERVTPGLKNEILQAISNQNLEPSTQHQPFAYAIPRRNFYLGRQMRFGGSWPDYVKRLFRRDKLKRWRGRLHEEPVFEGKLGHLKEPMIHLTHRDLTSMVEKTRDWSKVEAELLYKAHHPPVTWWRILRIMLSEFWQRGIKLQGWRDGTVGWIEIIFQMFSRFITYAQLWEMQRSQ